MSDCLFCNIVAKKIPAEILFENAEVLAFRDIRPAGPQHALVIPKTHVAGLRDVGSDGAAMLGLLMMTAREVAEQLRLGESGYRLVVNQGRDGGQSVFHLHCHVIGGRALAWPPG
jgi:histidine triad (HIT) family protein